jgi:hypothetical protein
MAIWICLLYVARKGHEMKILDQITDGVLAYRPKIKTKAAKRRARRNKRAAKDKSKPKSRESTI